MWQQVQPLYDELHYYVKAKLATKYPGKFNPFDKTMPAHILGNMWAQSWVNLYSELRPYTNVTDVDVSEAMKEQDYTAKTMFELSDEFFQNLGLEDNKMSYGELAIIERPTDRDIQCHASAWDFCDKNDFRIKMCTKVC